MKGAVLSDAALLLDESDTVATAIQDVAAGDELVRDGRTVALVEAVPFGHKVALEPLEEGEPIRKYGEVVGTASRRIEAGEWVHTHNCDSNRGRGDLAAAAAGGAGE